MMRPLERDPEIKKIAIASLAGECAKWQGDDDVEGWKETLSRCSLYDNGFEIAYELRNRYYVDGIDLELVEILDYALSYIWNAHRDAVKAWVKANDIKPELKVGDAIECRHGVGFINGINEEEAIYLFVSEDERDKPSYAGGGGIHIEFENAKAIEATALADKE